MTEGKPIRGTREWAVANIDCCTGCSHDCRYCYARYDQVDRRGLLTAEEWRTCRLRVDEVKCSRPLYPGQVMFPATHDILPEILEECLAVITALLRAGNRVLVVSKPHLECVQEMCRVFTAHREKLLFRFTITARDEGVLSFWEPGAPGYLERKESLRQAFTAGYQTSVSVEPMLDTPDVVAMVYELLPWVSHSIWLGKMNKVDERVQIDSDATRCEVERITAGQQDQVIRELYLRLHHEPLLRWKESIKQVVGLALPDKPGMDE